MKSLSLLLVVAVAVSAFAQDDLRDELNAEISVLYPKTTLKKKPAVKKVAARESIDLDDTRSVIINNNVTSDKVTEQPPTTISASPVEVSKGEETRKAREQFERGTEDVIVQQLEKDRLEAEKERSKKAQNIFNKEAEVVAPVAPIAVQEVAPVVVPVTQTVKAEVETAQTLSSEGVGAYIGALAGTGDYTSATNVDGKAALGLIGGVTFPEGFMLEGSLLWSEYDVNNVYTCYQLDFYGNCVAGSITPITQRMTQWNIGVGGKYSFLRNGRIQPVIGASLNYVRRSFQNRYNNTNYSYYNNTRQNYPDTWALDGGLTVGANVRLSDSFSIGADLRYMMNLTYDRQDNPQTRSYNGTQPIEEMSYYIFGVNGIFRF